MADGGMAEYTVVPRNQVHKLPDTVGLEMGALATKMLIGILQGETPENTLCKIPTRLIIRESCQAPTSQ